MCRPLLPLFALALAWLPACSHRTTVERPTPNAHPFLWKVEGHGAEGWLFGTMHVSDPRVTTLAPIVEEALAAADSLSTELDEAPANGARLAEAGRLPEGQTLRGLVGAELDQAIHDYLRSRQMDNDLIEAMQPWMVALQLAQIDAIPLLQGGQPLDILLRQRFREAGKEVGQVETIDEQIEVLAWGSQEDQIHLLKVTLDKLREEQATGESSLQRLLGYYLSGNAEEMWSYALSQTDFEDPIQVGAWRALTTERNRRMAARIDERLRAEPAKKQFFAFGTLHFLGPESVVAALRDRGYSVTRLSSDAPAPVEEKAGPDSK